MDTSNTPAVAPEPIAQLARNQLARLANKIDQEGFYPREFMHALGERGGFGATADTHAQGAPAVALSHHLRTMVTVGR